MDQNFELWRGAYVLHAIYARDLASGDIGCVVQFVVAGQLQCVWQVQFSLDGRWLAFEVWSSTDRLNWWYGYSSEAALLDEIRAQLFRR
jgi:hypothetical protein